GPWMLITGQGVGLVRDLLMALSWAINLGVAELIIRARARTAPGQKARAAEVPAAALGRGAYGSSTGSAV
ncbi:MAG TPA: DUF2306 domain-containing protein, partial [Polyangia bacterium]